MLAVTLVSGFSNAESRAAAAVSGQYNFDSGGLTRSYLLHVPKQLAQGATLVIVMHGYTSSASNIMAYSGMNDVADEKGFVVVYPQGTIDQRGNAFFNVGYEFHAESEVDDIQFIRDLTAHLQSELALDPNKTFAKQLRTPTVPVMTSATKSSAVQLNAALSVKPWLGARHGRGITVIPICSAT